MVTDLVKQNRAKAIDALRHNPKGYRQCSTFLRWINPDGKEERCATGLIADALGIEVIEDDYPNYDPYGDVEEALGIDVDLIWQMNDTEHLTYSEIADELEKMWGMT